MGPITFDVEVLRDSQTEKKEVKIPNCWICQDEGYQLYNKKIDGHEYPYIARCTCEAGMRYMYDGTKCKKPSPYYIPSIADIVDPEMLARENLNKFIEEYKGNESVMNELKMRGIQQVINH